MTLKEQKERLHRAQIGHYLEAERYLKKHYKLGIPLVILSAITNIGVLYQVDFDKLNILMYILIFSTILVTILSSLQTFLNFYQKAELHKTMAIKYGKLKRYVEILLTQNLSKEKQIKEIKKIQNEWNNIAEVSPITSNKIRKKIKDILKDEV